MWNPFARAESRNFENPQYPLNGSNILQLFGGGDLSASDIVVNQETSMKVPAYAGGVNFLSGTLAGLPLHAYRKTKEGRKKIGGSLSNILHNAVNDEASSFEWRKGLFDSVFTTGRGVSYIERADSGALLNIWPVDPSCVTVKRENGRKLYKYRENDRKEVIYSASEIIDIPFMLKPDGVTHRSPLHMGRDAIGLALSLTKYGSKFFSGGGVPPFAITGNFQSSAALKAAADDMQKAVRKASKEKRLAITLPAGLEIKSIGTDPEKMQMIDMQRFSVEQIARILSLPPVFLQDLTHGTFSNTEQQDLHFVKHTLKRWVEQFEQELNLKLFGRGSNRYVELSVDGLLRGDFKTRMDGYAQGIQSGVFMPNECRGRENLPDGEGGDKLFMQGATLPISQLGQDNANANGGENE